MVSWAVLSPAPITVGGGSGGGGGSLESPPPPPRTPQSPTLRPVQRPRTELAGGHPASGSPGCGPGHLPGLWLSVPAPFPPPCSPPPAPPRLQEEDALLPPCGHGEPGGLCRASEALGPLGAAGRSPGLSLHTTTCALRPPSLLRGRTCTGSGRCTWPQPGTPQHLSAGHPRQIFERRLGPRSCGVWGLGATLRSQTVLGFRAPHATASQTSFPSRLPGSRGQYVPLPPPGPDLSLQWVQSTRPWTPPESALALF